MSEDEFTAHVNAGDFLEWAQVHAHRYGTLVSEIDRNLKDGNSLILEIDVQGALNVKKRIPSAVLVFIEPPSLEVLRERLVCRGTEDDASVELRMRNALVEMELADRYDVRVVNDDLDVATDELVNILTS